ncbi:MAG: aminopeptidase [Veillonellales bacterium]
MNEGLLEKYASLVVKMGVNIHKGQTLVISSPLECAPFVRILSRAAYQQGAREVVLNWKDELSAQIKFMHAPEEIFDDFPDWQKEFYLFYLRQGAAFISIAASDPELLKNVDPTRVARTQKAGNTALKEYRESMMSNKNVWSVISVPTKAWAKKVFPDMDEASAVGKLWEAILQTVRVDAADPAAAWEQHKQNLKTRMNFLNSHQFKFLRYQNSLGTKLTVELPANHIWLGGSEYTPEGVEFMANMPTEEVFTMPKKTGVNGTVFSSRPLNYNGSLIDRFSLTFKAGKIVDFTAETGDEILKKLIETDEGSCYLGEVALVPYDSPISNSKILYYNTLFDENASCHLAMGKAYPVCLQNGENMTKKALEQAGANDSLVHVDFMVGTEDLTIIGVTADGKEIPVFKDGNFARK